MGQSLKVLLIAASLVMGIAAPARAQAPAAEIGTSLMSLMVGFGNDSLGTTFGVPSGGFGIVNPGLYLSAFAGPKVAIEPQVGLIVLSSEGETAHFLNLGAQVDYFIKGTRESSPYVFGGVGLVHISHVDETPKSFGAGVGYRAVLGDRLTMRVDGRFTHYTNGGSNAIAITLSLGGLFGRR